MDVSRIACFKSHVTGEETCQTSNVKWILGQSVFSEAFPNFLWFCCWFYEHNSPANDNIVYSCSIHCWRGSFYITILGPDSCRTKDFCFLKYGFVYLMMNTCFGGCYWATCRPTEIWINRLIKNIDVVVPNCTEVNYGCAKVQGVK